MTAPRLAAAGILLVAAIVADTRLDRLVESGAAVEAAARLPLREFPRSIGLWRVDSFELPARQMRLLGADDYLRADFLPSDGSPAISAYVGYYANSDRAAQHLPTICYGGSGWLEVYSGSALLDAGKQPPLRVSEMVFDSAGEKQLVIYWISMSGYEGAGSAMRKWARLTQALAGKGRAGAAKIEVATSIDISRETAQARLETFLRVFLPELEVFIP
jgi:EpsI family protein